MFDTIALLICMLACVSVTFRYISLVHAIHTIKKEIDDLNQDLTQNQIVHLPLPDRHLQKLLCSINDTFEGIQKERQRYEKREKEFQKQIENISHDLRTPLTVILGYLKLLKKSETITFTKDPELRDTLIILEQKAEVMKHLVSQFYDYSRLNADDYKLTLQNVDLSRTLRESLMGNYQILEQKHLNIDIHIPEHPVWVLGETAALERIFFNLFQNAGRYADSAFQISVEEHTESIAVLFINDTRMLSKEDIPYLFDRFYITDHSRSRGGTGLGLTVAKSLAEKMNGSLTADIPVHAETASDTATENKFQVCFTLCLQTAADTSTFI